MHSDAIVIASMLMIISFVVVIFINVNMTAPFDNESTTVYLYDVVISACGTRRENNFEQELAKTGCKNANWKFAAEAFDKTVNLLLFICALAWFLFRRDRITL